jgi:hypothetical protein
MLEYDLLRMYVIPDNDEDDNLEEDLNVKFSIDFESYFLHGSTGGFNFNFLRYYVKKIEIM